MSWSQQFQAAMAGLPMGDVMPIDPGMSAAPGAGTVYGPHAAYPGQQPMIPDLRKPNPLVLLGTTLLGALMGGGTGGALAGLGGGAAGYNNYRQALIGQQQAQQQLDTQAASQQAQQHFMEAQARQAQIDALDRQIAQDDAFFRDPEALIRSGLAQPELLQNAVAEANLRRHQRGYTGVDLSFQDISRAVQDFRRKYPEMYGGAGWQWNAETQRYERTPVPPGAGGLRPGERPVTPEQYQQRGPMGPAVPANYIDPTAVRPGNPDYTGMPPGWHPPMAVPQGDAGAPPPGAPAGAPPPGSPADAPPTGPAFLGANPAASAGAPGAATVAGPTQIRVPGIAAPITIPESMYAAAGFNPQTMEANLLQAGFAPEHATAMAASQQAGLIERAKQDMGIAQLPMSLQQAALSMAATRADVELKYAQAVHERNEPLMELYNARLKQIDQQQHQTELEQTGSHNLSQEQQTTLAHYQDSIKAGEGSRQSQLQALLATLEKAQHDAYEATDKLTGTTGGQAGRTIGGGGAFGALGTLLGQLTGLSAISALQKSTGRNLMLNVAGATDAELSAAVAAARATPVPGGIVTAVKAAMAGVPEALGPLGIAAVVGLLAGGAYLSIVRSQDGTSHAIVTSQGRNLDLRLQPVQKYLQLQARADALSSVPAYPIPRSYEEMLLDKPTTRPQELAAVRAMINHPGGKDRSGNVIPSFQDAYYAMLGTAGPVAAYRLIRAYQGAFSGKPIPIRLGQPGSPFAPVPQAPYGSNPFVAAPAKPAVAPPPAGPPPPKNAAEAAKRMIQSGPQSPFGSGRGLLPWARGQGEGLFVYPP